MNYPVQAQPHSRVLDSGFCFSLQSCVCVSACRTPRTTERGIASLLSHHHGSEPGMEFTVLTKAIPTLFHSLFLVYDYYSYKMF